MGPLVVVESPVRATDVYSREQFMRYFYECCLDCFKRGEVPYGSHWMTAFLDDDDPLDRATGIGAGYLWGSKAKTAVMYVDLGVSEGMLQAKRFYESREIPVLRRTLGYRVIKMIGEMSAASDSAAYAEPELTDFS